MKDWIDAEEVEEEEELTHHIAYCTIHAMEINCQASLPECVREYVTSPKLTVEFFSDNMLSDS